LRVLLGSYLISNVILLSSYKIFLKFDISGMMSAHKQLEQKMNELKEPIDSMGTNCTHSQLDKMIDIYKKLWK